MLCPGRLSNVRADSSWPRPVRGAELLREYGYTFDVIVPPLPEPTNLPPHMPPAEQAEYLSCFKATSVTDARSGEPLPEQATGGKSRPGKEAQWGVSSTGTARGSAAPIRPDSPVILAADTIAALGNRVFGKPADRADAGRILTALAGTAHHVITGLTLMDPAGRRHVTRHDVTAVHMRLLTEAELEDYLDSNAWCGKAGAYGIQDKGDEFVSRIEGSFSNVVGLPMELLSQMIADWT